MKTVEFTSEELEILKQLIQHVLSDMEIEVFRTDTRDFKELLKHRRDVLEHVLDKVGSTVAA